MWASCGVTQHQLDYWNKMEEPSNYVCCFVATLYVHTYMSTNIALEYEL